ncbi:MAG: nucleoside deaminase [Chitinophagales bacterium]
MTDKDVFWMEKAMEQAQIAYEKEEIPVGCIITYGDSIIAKAHNQTQMLSDPTAHAEMIAITAACDYIGGKYLKDCTLYVTLEPCPMCAAAIHWSQLGKLVYAASDPKMGFSNYEPSLLPNCKTSGGIIADPAQKLLQKFFKERREQ